MVQEDEEWNQRVVSDGSKMRRLVAGMTRSDMKEIIEHILS